jgi:hypothetical protein
VECQALDVDSIEKGQSDDVVVVQVRQQQMYFILRLPLFATAKRSNTGTGIDYDCR